MYPPQVAAPAIEPDRALRVGPPVEHLVGEEAIDARQVPKRPFLVDTVRSLDPAQRGEGLDPRTTRDRRILLPLDQALSVQILLQCEPARAGGRLGPLLGHPIAALDFAVVLRFARRDPRHPHAQPE